MARGGRKGRDAMVSSQQSGPEAGLALRRDEPIVLRGRPDELVGMVELANEGESDLFVKGFDIVESSLPERCLPARRRLFVQQRLPAGAAARVPVIAAVDDTTPPGRHEAIIVVGGRQRRAILEVRPHRSVELTPQSVELTGAAGEAPTETFLFENRGNVPIELGAVGLVVLQEQEQVCRSLQHALAEAEGKGYEAFLDTLVNDLARKRVDLMRVRAAGGRRELAPGETEEVALEFHIPGNVASGRTYRGKLLAFDRSIGVRLTVTAGGRQPEEPPSDIVR